MSPERAAEVSERSDKDTDRASDPDHTFAFLFAVGGAREQGHRENGRGPTTPTTKTLGVSATTFETRPRGRIGTDVAGKGAGGVRVFRTAPPRPTLCPLTLFASGSRSRFRVAKAFGPSGRRFDPQFLSRRPPRHGISKRNGRQKYRTTFPRFGRPASPAQQLDKAERALLGRRGGSWSRVRSELEGMYRHGGSCLMRRNVRASGVVGRPADLWVEARRGFSELLPEEGVRGPWVYPHEGGTRRRQARPTRESLTPHPHLSLSLCVCVPCGAQRQECEYAEAWCDIASPPRPGGDQQTSVRRDEGEPAVG